MRFQERRFEIEQAAERGMFLRCLAAKEPRGATELAFFLDRLSL